MSSRVLSEAAFARVIRAGDSQRFEIDLKLHRESLLNDAVAFAGAKPASLPTPHATVLRGKPCVSYSDFSTHLILRAIARHLQRRLKISLPNRDRIVRGVIESLMDATPMYVMRRDITSFYESIPLGSLRETLLFDTASSAQVRAFLRVYFEQHCSGKICGLPRGIGLSAVLAEIAMRRFDQRVREIPGVYKYFRFSDDMIIFSYRPASDLAPLVADAVPEPMQFNKTKSYDVCLADPKNSTSEVGFEFLGYRFDVSAASGTKASRKVRVSVSSKKIGRMKTRLISSFRAFLIDRDYILLRDRIGFITSNYQVRRSGVSQTGPSMYVKSGIFYNYRLSGIYSAAKSRTKFEVSPATELKNLDGFLRSLIRGPTSSFASSLTAGQKRILLRYSFFQGFDKRMVVRFGSARVHAIKAAWANHG